MRRSIAIFCIILIASFSLSACAETVMRPGEFRITLSDEWALADATILSQLSFVLPQAAQCPVSLAFNEEGAALCAFVRPSEGMTIELMQLFQSEYIRRIEEAIPFSAAENISTGAGRFGANNCFYILMTVMDIPICVFYHFSGQSVLTVCSAGVESSDMNAILATIAASNVF